MLERSFDCLVTGHSCRRHVQRGRCNRHQHRSCTGRLGAHEIVYTYVDANGCTNSDTSTVFVEVCTLIAQADASSISVQPNPFADHFTLSGSTVGAWIRVCDMTGREVANARVTSGRASFDSSAWPSGVYCVQQSGDHPLTFRLVKQ